MKWSRVGVVEDGFLNNIVVGRGDGLVHFIRKWGGRIRVLVVVAALVVLANVSSSELVGVASSQDGAVERRSEGVAGCGWPFSDVRETHSGIFSSVGIQSDVVVPVVVVSEAHQIVTIVIWERLYSTLNGAFVWNFGVDSTQLKQILVAPLRQVREVGLSPSGCPIRRELFLTKFIRSSSSRRPSSKQ